MPSNFTIETHSEAEAVAACRNEARQVSLSPLDASEVSNLLYCIL